MLLDTEATQYLKPWLVRTLEPICDAEPGALADYILALLKHNAPESDLRKELAAQLDEFLEKEGPPFIDTLFTALRTKSYLPYSAPSPPAGQSTPSTSHSVDTGIPIPLDALLSPTSPSERGRKRSLEHDDRDLRPSKGARLGDDGQFSRYGRGGSWGAREGRGGRMMISGRADYMDGGMNSAMELGIGGPTMNGRGAYRPPERSRGICRDYHNNGYCARGAFCKYSHGDDAVVPGQLFPMNGMPGGAGAYVPMMAAGSGMAFPMAAPSNTPYDPHERMDMRPMTGSSVGMSSGRTSAPRPAMMRQGDVARKPGELPVIQDLTPAMSQEDQTAALNGGLDGTTNDAYDPMAASRDVDMGLPPNPMSHMRNGFRHPRGGAHGRGTFNGDAASFRPERRGDKTLVVEKIPEDKLSLGSINDWFKKFGTVTNVAVDAHGSKALVSFSNHEEAYAAWKSEDAVFGNRFVKVFWHRPMEGRGQLGARMLAASANLVAKVSAKDEAPTETSGPAPLPIPARKTPTSSTVLALAAKQHLLEQQIAEQKSLMAKLSTASAEEKKEIMARLRKLNEEMKPATPSTPAKSASPAPAPTGPGIKSRGNTPRTEEQLRERLDKELELHNAVTAAEGESEESTEELKARLEKLKAEAASLGITDAVADITPHYSGGPYRPYRGRGRGRGFYRGRGGPPRGSMKLDNRPKKLLIKGVSVDQLQAVRDWYETTGQVDSAEPTDDGDIIVSFKSRSAAEQGFAKGANIAAVGPVQISWHAGQTSAATNGVTPIPTVHHEPEDTILHNVDTGTPELHEDAPMQEEIDSGGWGGDDFGML
ncbi:hypothetical protein NM688_g6809 [Phlebia brevispora]|uniref:Uncharacterized protein n=1 Tax=Phlebia brevispora TaxID=194682 RepID=A0ACC1SCA2_9APHY|nr:hypothetical protein NM688_g6809 [Phlebia brevispora]